MDTFSLLAAERRRLADELMTLSAAEWERDSLCDGWTNHTVAAHLNLGWAGSKLGLLLGLVRALGRLDQAMDRASRDLANRMPPATCAAMLREHAADRFVPPTMPPEAPLSDVVLHGADILRPLGRSVRVAPDALSAVLGFLTSAPAKRAFRSVPLDELSFRATDVDWHWAADRVPDASGATPGGPLVSGPALAIAGVLVGRRAYVGDLTGDGVPRLVSQLPAA